jgi:hypothetical protein
MPPKARKNAAIDPDEDHGDAEELRDVAAIDPIDALMHELGAAGGTARVLVRKIAPIAEQGYVGEWSPADFNLAALAELAGPGKYAAQVRDATGRYLRQFTLDVSPRVRRVGGGGSGGAGAWTPAPPAPPAPPAAPAAPSLTDTLLVTLMQQQGEMLRALASRPATTDGGLAILGSIVPAIMRDRSGSDTLIRAVEMVDRLRGDPEPAEPVSPQAAEMRMVERIIERVAGMLERRGPTAPALESTARTAPTSPTNPTNPTNPAPPPTPPTSPADAPKPVQLPALVVLIAAAADDGRIRPAIVAQAVLDSIGVDTARRYVGLPEGTLAGEVIAMIPRLEARREYLAAVEHAVRDAVREPAPAMEHSDHDEHGEHDARVDA